MLALARVKCHGYSGDDVSPFWLTTPCSHNEAALCHVHAICIQPMPFFPSEILTLIHFLMFVLTVFIPIPKSTGPLLNLTLRVPIFSIPDRIIKEDPTLPLQFSQQTG